MNLRFSLKLGLPFLSLILGLFLAEFSLRLWFYLTRSIEPVACRRPDNLLNHALVPNSTCRFKTREWDVTFQVNNLGMRDQDYSTTKSPGTYRILLLGDSFAEGYGVSLEHTYQYLLERQLNQAYDFPIEVLNAGVIGYSPHLEYLYLLKTGFSLQPDLVILNLDLSDFSDEQRYQALAKDLTAETLLSQIGPQTISPEITHDQWERAPVLSQPVPSVTWLPFIPVQLKWWLHQHSRLYDLSIKTLKKKFYPETLPELADFVPGDPTNDSFVILRDLPEAQYQNLWQLPQEYLLKITTLVNQRRIPLILTLHPRAHQLSPQEWSLGRRRWNFAPDTVYSLRPQQDLQRFAAANGILYANVTPAFQQATVSNNRRRLFRRNKPALFFAYDDHFTPTGHQVMANALFEFLAQNIFNDPDAH